MPTLSSLWSPKVIIVITSCSPRWWQMWRHDDSRLSVQWHIKYLTNVWYFGTSVLPMIICYLTYCYIQVAPGNHKLWPWVPVTTIQKSFRLERSSLKKYIKFSSITFQFCISILSCFFDLLQVELHQEELASAINSNTHIEIAACFENLPERPNVKCIWKR